MIDAVPLRKEPDGPRVLLFGLNNDTTSIVLRELLSQGIRPLALLLPDSAAPHLISEGPTLSIVVPPDTTLSILAPREVSHITHEAWAAGLPVWVVRDLGSHETLEALAELSAEVGVVACFSRRIPKKVRQLFAAGVLNIHPSLLPKYRGPAPLFWQFRAGESEFGVTVHLMDDSFDTGEIVAQQVVDLYGGIPTSLATKALTEAGASLVVKALIDIQRSVTTPFAQTAGGSSFGWPTEDDFTIDQTWTARRAFDFMRSTAEWGRPYRIDIAGETIVLSEALALSAQTRADVIYYESNNIAWISLTDGAVRARLV